MFSLDKSANTWPAIVVSKSGLVFTERGNKTDAATWLLTSTQNVTAILASLHWLLVLGLFSFYCFYSKCLHALAPKYLSDLLQLYVLANVFILFLLFY